MSPPTVVTSLGAFVYPGCCKRRGPCLSSLLLFGGDTPQPARATDTPISSAYWDPQSHQSYLGAQNVFGTGESSIPEPAASGDRRPALGVCPAARGTRLAAVVPPPHAHSASCIFAQEMHSVCSPVQRQGNRSTCVSTSTSMGGAGGGSRICGVGCWCRELVRKYTPAGYRRVGQRPRLERGPVDVCLSHESRRVDGQTRPCARAHAVASAASATITPPGPPLAGQPPHPPSPGDLVSVITVLIFVREAGEGIPIAQWRPACLLSFFFFSPEGIPSKYSPTTT